MKFTLSPTRNILRGLLYGKAYCEYALLSLVLHMLILIYGRYAEREPAVPVKADRFHGYHRA
jgi:hypothetical protein